MMKKKIIGLTGGIASGKSSAAGILRALGATVIDADEIGRRILDRGTPAYEETVRTFGKEYLDGEGNLLRKKLGNYVFANPAALAQLNAITHPQILKQIRREICEKDGLVVLDCALLFETGLEVLVDEVWTVAVDTQTRIERAMIRDGLSRKEIENRIKNQSSEEEKERRADVVLDNNGSIGDLERQIRQKVREIYGEEES